MLWTISAVDGTTSRSLERRPCEVGRWVRETSYFLRHGLLQGVPEEYHAWEQDSTLRPRHAFDGVGLALEYRPFAESTRTPFVRSMRFEIKYLAGYDPIARYNTVRGEFGLAPWGLPLAVWVQDGYMNSLARYYKKTSSAGIELRFVQF